LCTEVIVEISTGNSVTFWLRPKFRDSPVWKFVIGMAKTN